MKRSAPRARRPASALRGYDAPPSDAPHATMIRLNTIRPPTINSIRHLLPAGERGGNLSKRELSGAAQARELGEQLPDPVDERGDGEVGTHDRHDPAALHPEDHSPARRRPLPPLPLDFGQR